MNLEMQQNNHGAGSGWPWASLLLTAAAVLVYYAPGLAGPLLYLHDSGWNEAWRYLTCHWVHWSGSHLFWSGGMFLLLGAFCEDLGRRRFGLCLALSAMVIPIGLRLFTPELGSYGGLSGIDSAFFGLLAVATLQESHQTGKWTSAGLVGLLSAGFALKIGYEFVTGDTAFVRATDQMVPVPLAHVLGVLSGMAIDIGGWLADRRWPKDVELNNTADGAGGVDRLKKSPNRCCLASDIAQ